MSRMIRWRWLVALGVMAAGSVAAQAQRGPCDRMNNGPDIRGQGSGRPCIDRPPEPRTDAPCNCVVSLYTSRRTIAQDGLFQECRGHYNESSGKCRLAAGGSLIEAECESGFHDAPYGNWGVQVRNAEVRNPPATLPAVQVVEMSDVRDCNQWPGTKLKPRGCGKVDCRMWHSCTCDALRDQPNHFPDQPPAEFLSELPNAPLAGFFRLASLSPACSVALSGKSLDLRFGMDIFELDGDVLPPVGNRQSDLVTTLSVAEVVPMTCTDSRCEGSKALTLSGGPVGADALLAVACAGEQIIEPPPPPPGGGGGLPCLPGGSCQACCQGLCGIGFLCLADNLCHGTRRDERGLVIDQCLGTTPPPPPPPPPAVGLTVTPAGLSFSATQGQPVPGAQAVAIRSTGTPLSWTVTENAPWLSLSPAAGTTPGATNASVDASALAAGSYNATVTVAAPGAAPVAVPVALTVTAAPPPPPVAQLTANPASLSFTATQGGSNPPARPLTIGSSGAPLAVTLSDDAAFLTVTPGAGTTTLTASVAVSIAGLTPGTYSGTVRATASGAGNSPLNVPVSLTVAPPAGPAPPVITGFTPASGPVGTVVRISGSSLGTTTEVRINDVPGSVSLGPVSNTQIDVTVLPVATSGPIRVISPSGTATSPGIFTVVSVNTPAIDGFSPASGAPGTQVTIVGRNLQVVQNVFFNNQVTVFQEVAGGTQLRATVPSGATSGPIRVVTATGSVTSAQSFTVGAAPPPPPPPPAGPVISGFSPLGGPVGVNVAISGSGLASATSVTFAPQRSAVFFAESDGLIRATVPVGAVDGPIQVVTPAGTAVSPASFDVTTPAGPVITGFTPASGPVGTVVRISGSSLGTTTEVRINDVPGSVSLGPVSNTQIDVTVLPVATSGPIRVISPSGTATSPGIFTVVSVNTPAIDGFSPASGAPGTQVTIVGRNLQVVQNVFFNNQVTVFQEVAGGTQLRATVPSGATSGPIRVVTATGSVTSGQSFIVTPQ